MVPALPSRPERRIDDLAPVPLLSLGSHLATNYQPGNRRMVSEYQHRAGLAFLYGSARVHGKRDGERIRHPADDELQLIARQPQAEQALRKQLEQLGFRPALRQSLALPKESAEMFQLPGEEAWIRFVQQQLPELRRQGWQIDIHPGFAYDLTAIDAWYAEIDESAADDWFDLDLGVVVDGQRIGILPVLLRLIRQSPQLLTPRALAQRGDDEQLRVQLERRDGQPLQVALPFSRIKPILATLGELYMREPMDGPALRLSKADGARLAGLEGLAPHWRGGEQLRAFARRLHSPGTQPGQPPASLNATLRPYQLQGLAWMQTLRELAPAASSVMTWASARHCRAWHTSSPKSRPDAWTAPRWW